MKRRGLLGFSASYSEGMARDGARAPRSLVPGTVAAAPAVGSSGETSVGASHALEEDEAVSYTHLTLPTILLV
eukprot:5203753-Pyramimonas_sp.AAC.1